MRSIVTDASQSSRARTDWARAGAPRCAG